MSELTPAKKKAYAAALLHLSTYLKLDKTNYINIETWCNRYKVKPTIFDALIALGAVVKDERKSDEKHIYLTRTKKLVSITPEDIAAQLEGDTPPAKKGKVVKTIVDEPVAENPAPVSLPQADAVVVTNELPTDLMPDDADVIEPAPRLNQWPEEEPIESVATIFTVFNVLSLPQRSIKTTAATISVSDSVIRFNTTAATLLGVKSGCTLQFLKSKTGSWYIEVNPARYGYPIRTKGTDGICFGHKGLCDLIRSSLKLTGTLIIPLGEKDQTGYFPLLTQNTRKR